jgi:predicted nucleotidyltransferase/uncharacterized protein (UPF0332 family)
MEFDIEKNTEPMNKEKFSDEEFDLSLEFAKKIKHEFKDLIRGIILFGSVNRGEHKKSSDIDVLVIIDDIQINLTQELVESYRIITERLIGEVSTKLHVTSLKYTTFWEYVRLGDPVGINILREGTALIDTGFFAPLQALLKQGRVRPSAEAIWSYFSRAPTTLSNAKWHVMQGALDLYWAVVDSAQAILMKYNEMPPPPEMLGDVMNEKLVSKGILNKKHVEIVKEFFALSKYIIHRDMKELSGKDFDEYYKKAYEFINDIKEILESA